MDSEVSRSNSEIQNANQRRGEIQASMQEEQAHLDVVKQQLDDRQAALDKRLRGSYKSDDASYLGVMMGADDFTDFINRMDAINTIADSDRQLITSISDSKKSVEDKLNSLASKQHELDGLVSSLSSDQENLVAAKEHQQSVVNSIQGQIQANNGELAQLQSEAASIEARMSEVQSETPSGGGGGNNGDTPPAAGGTTITVVATSYCLGGRTATGMPVGRGVIAVDPRVIPLGSRVHVSGYGDAIAADTGGAIVGNRIDVWLPCGEAYAWGNRTVTVTVY